MNPIPKIKTNRSKKYLEWLRRQDCCYCGESRRYGFLDMVPTHKGGGVALKGSDFDAVSLCTWCHAEEHRGAKTFWKKVFQKTGKTRDDFVLELNQKYKGEVNGNN